MVADPLVVVWVVVAAAAGALVRHGVGLALNRDFPVGTLAVNLIASFVLGLTAGLDGAWSIVIGIGALGALSTWSAAANEAAVMAREEQGAMALAYLGLSVSAGVLAAWLGLTMAAWLGWR